MVFLETTIITDVNPFIYSHPLSPEEIIDRNEETQELLRNVVGGHFVRLFAPRKYGKTSLLKRALRDGEAHEGLIPVLVDLYRVSSIADVTVRFERAYSRHLKGALRAKVEEFLQKTGIGLSLAPTASARSCDSTPRPIHCRRCTHCSICRFGSRRVVATGHSSRSTSFRTSTRSPTSTA